jgi:SAM-dependent methyltransferase
LRRVARAAVCAALLAWLVPLAAQDSGPVHDAPYVPSPQVTVEEMLRLANVGAEDVVYDLGSGNGRVVITAAARFGARGVGVERDPALIVRSREAAAVAGVADRVRFLQQDLFATALDEATVVALYLSPNLNLKLRPALLALRPGTRIVSHSSGLGDWQPDRRTAIGKDVLLWLVPARVAGRWRAQLGQGARTLEIELSQQFQRVTGEARLDARPAKLWEASLEADQLRFVIADLLGQEPALYFEGRVRGGAIEGTVARGVGKARVLAPWRAERAGR